MEVDKKEFIIDNNIFKFLFFDKYLINNNGASQINIAKVYFQDYVFPEIDKIEEFKIFRPHKIINFRLYFKILLQINKLLIEEDLINTDNSKILEIIQEFYKIEQFIIFSGWGGNNGHAISIFVEKEKDKKKDLYTLYFINSGSGIQFQHNNVIIKYKNIEKKQINKFIFFNIFMSKNQVIQRDIIYNLEKIIQNEYNSFLFDIDDKIQEENKLNSLFYEYVNIFFGTNQEPEKVIEGETQYSGTCSFYSLYWLLYLLLDGINFEQINDNIKHKLLLELQKEIPIIIENNQLLLPKYLNALIILQKDYTNILNNEYIDLYSRLIYQDYLGKYTKFNYYIIETLDFFTPLKQLYDFILKVCKDLLTFENQSLCLFIMLDFIIVFIKRHMNNDLHYNIIIKQELIIFLCILKIFNTLQIIIFKINYLDKIKYDLFKSKILELNELINKSFLFNYINITPISFQTTHLVINLFLNIVEFPEDYDETIELEHRDTIYSDDFIQSFLFKILKSIKYLNNFIDYNDYFNKIIKYRKELITITDFALEVSCFLILNYDFNSFCINYEYIYLTDYTAENKSSLIRNNKQTKLNLIILEKIKINNIEEKKNKDYHIINSNLKNNNYIIYLLSSIENIILNINNNITNINYDDNLQINIFDYISNTFTHIYSENKFILNHRDVNIQLNFKNIYYIENLKFILLKLNFDIFIENIHDLDIHIVNLLLLLYLNFFTLDKSIIEILKNKINNDVFIYDILNYNFYDYLIGNDPSKLTQYIYQGNKEDQDEDDDNGADEDDEDKILYTTEHFYNKYSSSIIYLNILINLNIDTEYNNLFDYIKNNGIYKTGYSYYKNEEIQKYFKYNLFSCKDKLYYFYKNKEYEINIRNDIIIENGSQIINHYLLYDIIKDNKEMYILSNLLLKINILNLDYIIYNNSTIKLLDFDILIDYNDNNNILFKINDKDYKLINENNKEIRQWTMFLNNGFIIEHNNKKFIIILMKATYINNNILYIKHKDEYFVYNAKPLDYFKDKSIIHEDNFYIIEIHYTNISFIFNNSNEFSSLFISLIISKNVLCICLLINQFYCELNKNESKNNIYYDYLTFFSNNSIDFSYWPLLTNDKERKHLFNEIETNDIDMVKLSELNKLISLENIKILSKKIKKCSLRDYNIKTENKIKKYIKQFYYNCNTKTNLQPEIENILGYKHFTPDKEILLYLINIEYNHSIPTLKNIYYNNCYEYYNRLCKIKINQIMYDLQYIKDNNLFKCDIVLKCIETLDPYIINLFNKPKNIEDIIFEIHTGNFIRTEQLKYIIKFKKDILFNNDVSQINKIKAYEILMGKGKTSTLSPLIILYLLLHQDFYNYNIILPEHLVLQSFEIFYKNIELLNVKKINKNIFENEENIINIFSDSYIKKELLGLYISNNQIINIFDDKSFFILDEIDTLINPLKSDLNIPINKKKHPEHDFIIDILLYISGLIMNFINFQVEYKENKINIKNKTFGNQVQDERTFCKENTKENHNFLKILTKKIQNVLLIINNKIYNKDYGFSKIEHIFNNKINKLFAIPYNGVQNPVESSDFSDFELIIILTILSYYKNEFIWNDTLNFILYIKQFVIDKDHTISKKKCSCLYNIFTELQIDNIIDNLNKSLINKIKIEYTKIINDYMNESIENKKEILNFYLINIIFNDFEIPEYQYNISFIDILDNELIKNKLIFSGTVNFYTPYDIISNLEFKSSFDKYSFNKYKKHSFNKYKNLQLKKIINDDITQGSIIASILGTTQEKLYKPIDIVQYLESDFLEMDNEDELIDFFNNQDINIYNAIIDVAGIILKNNPTQFIEKIKAKLDGFDILYIKNNEKYIYNQNKKYNNEIFEKVFIFYDHKNCIGIDFKQPFKMHGLITLNINNNTTDVSQGIFRLRNINIGHSIDYYICKEIKEYFKINKKDINVIEIYNFLENKNRKYKENLLHYGKIQCLKFIKRKKNKTLESYKELIYYDTKQYYNTYENENIFYKKHLFNNLIYNNFLYNEQKLIKTHIQEKMIESNEKIKTLENERLKNTTDLCFNEIVKDCISDDYKTIDYLNCEIINYFTFREYEEDELLTFGDFEIILSLQIINALNDNIYFTYIPLYFIINLVDKKILIINIFDLHIIMHDFKEFNELFQETIINKQIGIFDKYQNNITSKIFECIIPDLFKVILFENSNIPIIQKKKIIDDIYQIENYQDKLYFIQSILNIEYNFNSIVNDL